MLGGRFAAVEFCTAQRQDTAVKIKIEKSLQNRHVETPSVISRGAISRGAISRGVVFKEAIVTYSDPFINATTRPTLAFAVAISLRARKRPSNSLRKEMALLDLIAC